MEFNSQWKLATSSHQESFVKQTPLDLFVWVIAQPSQRAKFGAISLEKKGY
jgi:hypothetical protein